MSARHLGSDKRVQKARHVVDTFERLQVHTLQPRFKSHDTVTRLPVVVYYCRTYIKAVRGGGVKRGDVCYGMLRAVAYVDESDQRTLVDPFRVPLMYVADSIPLIADSSIPIVLLLLSDGSTTTIGPIVVVLLSELQRRDAQVQRQLILD